MNTSTPLTDEFFDGELDKCPAAEFCRALERELNAERAARANADDSGKVLISKELHAEFLKSQAMARDLAEALRTYTKGWNSNGPVTKEQWEECRAALARFDAQQKGQP